MMRSLQPGTSHTVISRIDGASRANDPGHSTILTNVKGIVQNRAPKSVSDCYQQNTKEPGQSFQKYVDDIHCHDSLHNLLGADMVDVHGRLHIGGSETINDNRF